MAMNWLARLASGAPAPVCAATGPGCLDAVERLMARPALARAASPRAAAVLLVAGDIPEHDQPALDRLHDQIPVPRLTVHWSGEAEDAEARVLDAWRRICAGADGEPDRLPDTPPNEWRGKGDHGQGGKGMMGGVPYGRPMPMTGEDIRDGLQLDLYTMRVGPFAPMLLPGLVLELTLQGDVIVACRVCAPPYPQAEAADAPALCTARLLRLVGLGHAADRAVSGRRAHALGVRWGVPRGLGHLEGRGDVRARLAQWRAGRDGEAADGIFDALPGLEWFEAALVLASVTPSALRAAALTAIAAEDA